MRVGPVESSCSVGAPAAVHRGTTTRADFDKHQTRKKLGRLSLEIASAVKSDLRQPRLGIQDHRAAMTPSRWPLRLRPSAGARAPNLIAVHADHRAGQYLQVAFACRGAPDHRHLTAVLAGGRARWPTLISWRR